MRHRFPGVLLVTATAMLAQADIIEVPQDFPTIQQAINASVSGDDLQVAVGDAQRPRYNASAGSSGPRVTSLGFSPIESAGRYF